MSDQTLLYNRQQAADLLQISLSYLDKETKRKNIGCVRLGTSTRSRVLYKPIHLELYIEDHEISSIK